MRRTSRGFSLIETVVAMMILAGGIIVLANSWSGSLLAIRKARQANTTALLLQQKMTEFEILYDGKPLDEVKKEESGDFGTDYPGYTWTMESKKLEVPDLAAGLSARKEGVTEIEQLIIRKLTEYIEKSVLELKVTIKQQIRDKMLEFSATTYLVDYNQSLAGP